MKLDTGSAVSFLNLTRSFSVQVPLIFFSTFAGQPDASFDNTKRRFAWLKRTLKEFQDRYEVIFPTEWNIKPMIAHEFCRQTKLHLDSMLSTHHSTLDVTVIIEVLQSTIEFEFDLHKKFQSATSRNKQLDADDIDDQQTSVRVGKDGKVVIEAGTASDIKRRHEQDDESGNRKVYEKIRGKTMMSAHIYKFKGCISECFEPYLKSYSESEERKILESIETAMQNGDKLETIDFTIFGSSLHLFKSIKGSLKRCISFSTSKALFDLHITFKNVFRHYSRLLKRHLP